MRGGGREKERRGEGKERGGKREGERKGGENRGGGNKGKGERRGGEERGGEVSGASSEPVPRMSDSWILASRGGEGESQKRHGALIPLFIPLSFQGDSDPLGGEGTFSSNNSPLCSGPW